ncbi:MAG: flagellar hook-basal body complex protein FliE [Treponema sp.]|jgi:flagellar hook-basal body complex protein FliE|nr:flagellar hook-basal body complex protein FliE [Treponema sp.]
MNLFKPELLSVRDLPMMQANNMKTFVRGEKNTNIITGEAINELGNTIGADAANKAGSFDDAMLQALDMVSQLQQEPSNLIQQSITEPGSVDVHDITNAQAQASLALNISRTVLDRIVQGWNQIINTR